MKCTGCGAELMEGATSCATCGRSTTTGQKVAAESVHVAEKTGEVAGKIGKGLWGGVKAVGSGAKKGLKGEEEEKKA